MDGNERLLTTAGILELLQCEAQAEGASVESGAPDHCPWVGTTTQWLRDRVCQEEHPLPMAVPGRGREGHN